MKIALCSGEASGDRLAVDLLAALRRDGDVDAFGLAGPLMRKAGVRAIRDAEDATAVGIIEAIGAARRLNGLLDDLGAAIDREQPDVVVTIDSPGLLLRLAARVRATGRPTVHWVSPQVWAWRPGRVRDVARSVDTLLCLFPIEPPLYDGLGLDVVYTGHPRVAALAAKRRPRSGGAVIGLAPGSRRSEIEVLWPVLRDVAARVRAARPDARFVVPVAPTVDRAALAGVDATFTDGLDAVNDADVFIAASGTATLEIAARGVPLVVVYRVHPITWAIGRVLVRGVRHLSLPNILAGDGVVPEHLQALDAAAIAADVLRLLGPDGDAQLERLSPVIASLAVPDAIERAAAAVRARARAGPRR